MSDGHIFISYRRDDSAGYTRAIYDHLVKRFSKARVFMDVDTIEPGLPFDEAINQAVGRCEILIAMIGKRWMEERPGADPRINDAKDFVRLEIAAALSRNIRVIPVLLDGAVMPTEEALPEPLRALARRNAIEISNSRFDADVARLVEVVGKVLGETNVANRQEGLRSARPLLYWLVGGFIAVAIVYGVVHISQPVADRPSPPISSQPCYLRGGYPLGKWAISVEAGYKADFNKFVHFLEANTGTWAVDRVSGSFTTSAAPAPAAKVIVKLRLDSGGNYESTNNLVVSADGCRMEGTFHDTENHNGQVTLTWIADRKPPY
jgi:hypothetical protein